MAVIVRGDILELRTFSDRLESLILDSSGIQFVHKHVSASKLWIKEGESKDG